MKVRLSNSEYVMIDIPQEINQQGLYGLIKKLVRLQKFFSEGDVFSMKEEKRNDKNTENENAENNAENTENENTKTIKSKGTNVYPGFIKIYENKSTALEEYKAYISEGRRMRAKIYKVTPERYVGMIHYVKNKFKFPNRGRGRPYYSSPSSPSSSVQILPSNGNRNMNGNMNGNGDVSKNMSKISASRELSWVEIKNYYTNSPEWRRNRADELRIDFKNYGSRIGYIKTKWHFTASEIGVDSINLRDKSGGTA